MAITTRTYLRRAERDDLDVVVGWMESPEFQRFLYGDPARSPKQIRQQIVSMLGRGVGYTMPGGVYLIIESENEGPIGLLSLQNISWRNRSCSLDLFMGHEKHRSGIVAAISIYRVLEYCFDELNLHRITAFIYAFNTPSWRIFEKTGARRELHLREHVYRDGQAHDMYAYGLLRPEFDAFRAKHAAQADSGASLQSMIQGLATSEGDKA